MSTYPLISVIIPVYNRPKAFKKALDSVLRQTYKNIEIIVVDDGSKPGIRNPESGIRDDIQIYWSRQENKGAPTARNRGLEMAKGEYIIFWDADVVAEFTMLEKMVHALEKNKDISFTYSNYQLPITNYQSKKIPAQKFDINTLKQNNYIHTTSLIRKKDIIKWDESLKRFQDWDYWLTMVEQGKKGVWIDEYLFNIAGSGAISGWLPKCAYKKPWRWLPWVRTKVKKYEELKRIVLKKHGLVNE